MKTIKIDRFQIKWDGIQMRVGMPENEPDPVLAAADCIEAMAKEIIKMRELLMAVNSVTTQAEEDAAFAAVSTYINNLPK